MEAELGVTARETRFAGAPVPVRETVCGLLLALSWKVRVPVRAPVALGENVTAAVQLLPAAKVFGLMGQVVVATKSFALLAMDLIVREED